MWQKNKRPPDVPSESAERQPYLSDILNSRVLATAFSIIPEHNDGFGFNWHAPKREKIVQMELDELQGLLTVMNQDEDWAKKIERKAGFITRLIFSDCLERAGFTVRECDSSHEFTNGIVVLNSTRYFSNKNSVSEISGSIYDALPGMVGDLLPADGIRYMETELDDKNPSLVVKFLDHYYFISKEGG